MIDPLEPIYFEAVYRLLNDTDTLPITLVIGDIGSSTMVMMIGL